MSETSPYNPSRVAKGEVKILHIYKLAKVFVGMLAKINPLREI